MTRIGDDSFVPFTKLLMPRGLASLRKRARIESYIIAFERYENATHNLCWVFCALLGVLCN